MLFDLGLLKQFAEKLEHDENKVQRAVKKDIYPFIHNLTAFILEVCHTDHELEEKLSKQAFWNTLKDQLLISQRIFDVQWGEAEGVPDSPIASTGPQDIVVKHESEAVG